MAGFKCGSRGASVVVDIEVLPCETRADVVEEPGFMLALQISRDV